MDRPRPRPALRLLPLYLALALGACSDEEPPTPPVDQPPAHEDPPKPPPEDEPPPPVDPAVLSESEWADLSALWRKAATPESGITDDEKIRLEALFQEIAPPVEGAEWQVLTVIGRGPAELKANLMQHGLQIVSLDMQLRIDLEGEEPEAYGETTVAGYPAAVRNQFVFVMVGLAEMRMEGTGVRWRETAKVQALFERFPLERIAGL